MSDAPKHDYEALLRELRGEAEATFPGWSDFVRTLTEEKREALPRLRT